MSDLWRPFLVLFTFVAIVVVIGILIFSGGGDDGEESAADDTPTVTADVRPEELDVGARPRNPDAEEVAAADLEVGDCVADALTTTGNVKTFDKVDCDESHDGEVFTIIKLKDSARYPGVKFVSGKGERGCRARLRRQAVRKEFTRGGLGWKWLYPTRESWSLDEREVTCLATFKKPRKTALEQRSVES